ncbi:site-2 protease family protein [Nakamurella flavida]|uniref:Site-2 protease family protein n=1 Tax=Nakamurella flavida TaxID=363630 RepID=A0A938YLB2_9ACTN|nr:site-2 protease family protein [Nakamurella flavida]
MWVVAGFVLFVLALLFSVALHELGHLTFAKLFDVRTTQYMVGFGRTLFSRQRGETEYGLKAIPLGGYIRMVGMVPPDKQGRQRITTTSLGPAGIVRQIVEDARNGDRAQVSPADEGRQFYQLHPAKRIVIMLAGPLMNLVIAVFVFAALLMGLGVNSPTTTIAAVNACIIPTSDAGAGRTCAPGDAPTPAAVVGLLPGDRIVSFGGTAVQTWDELTPLIRDSAGQTVPLVYERAGQQVTVQVPVTENERGIYDDVGKQIGTEQVGFLGVSATTAYQTQSFGTAVDRTGEFIGRAAQAVVNIPARIPALWDSIFSGQPRDVNTPVGIYGAGRIGGEILASDFSAKDKISLFLNLVAGFNMSLFLINLLPLLPLDGGHVLGAAIEWLRRGWAKVRRKADPGPFDVAKLMPVAYVVALLFIGLTVLTFVADVVNPIKLFG